MRALKVFAVTFFVCSIVLFGANRLTSVWSTSEPWIVAESDEITVSVEDDRSVWLEGVTAGVRDDDSLTEYIRLTHVGKLNADGCLKATYTVTDDLGRSASLVRTVRFSDYTPPAFKLLKAPEYERNATVTLNELIVVNDPLDGDITHLVQVVSSNLNTSRAGTYEVYLTVENSYGVSVDHTLTIKVV